MVTIYVYEKYMQYVTIVKQEKLKIQLDIIIYSYSKQVISSYSIVNILFKYP